MDADGVSANVGKEAPSASLNGAENVLYQAGKYHLMLEKVR